MSPQHELLRLAMILLPAIAFELGAASFRSVVVTYLAMIASVVVITWEDELRGDRGE